MSESDNGSRRALIAVLAIISVVAAATVGWVVGQATDSSAAATVRLVPADSPGPDPFTQSVAIGDAAEFPTDVRAVITRTRNGFDTDPETRTLVTTGTAPGLYGGSGDTRTCDPAKLVSFLRANPAKARAWSNTLGISPNQIAGYVASLTPVVLTQDTLVTNHGYRNGTANAFNAVLQAGTAVMVDRTGTPRVKCNCGNPLGEPETIDLASASVQGTPWRTFTVTQVTVVQPATPTSQLRLVDIGTGDTFSQPVGSQEAADGQGVFAIAHGSGQSGAPTTIATSTDGKTWTPVTTLPDEQVLGLAFGNGTWVAVAHYGNSSYSRIQTSSDLVHWATVAEYPFTLRGVGYGNGRWQAVGTDFAAGADGAVIYTSTDAKNWTKTYSQFGVYPNSVAYGQGRWMSAGGQGTKGLPVFLISADGQQWDIADATIDARLTGGLAFANGTWLVGGEGWYSSTDGNTWTKNAPSTGDDSFAYGNDHWLAVSRDERGGQVDYEDGPSFVAESRDGTSWSRLTNLDQHVSAIAYGHASA